MYVEHYLDVVDNLPGNVARVMSRIHEIDMQRTQIASMIDTSLQGYLRNVSFLGHVVHKRYLLIVFLLLQSITESEKHKLLNKFLSSMVQLQHLSDTKICLAQTIYDQIDIKTRHLESQGRLVPPLSSSQMPSQVSAAQSSSSTSNANNNNNSHANSYANTNGTPNNSSARANNCVNASANQTPSSTLCRSESNNPTESKSAAAATSKDNAKEVSSSNQANGNGKRASRRAQGNNSKKESKEDSNGGSGGDDPSSTPVAAKESTSAKKTAATGKRGVKGGTRKANEGKRRKGSYNYNDDSPSGVFNAVDPNEPTYCLCEQVSYGEMICCDNGSCKIEWFHFACVGLNSIPKGRWYCPECRGDRSNIQKKDKQ